MCKFKIFVTLKKKLSFYALKYVKISLRIFSHFLIKCRKLFQEKALDSLTYTINGIAHYLNKYNRDGTNNKWGWLTHHYLNGLC